MVLCTIGIAALLVSCVEPAEPDDGLIENLPAVINTESSFSLYLKADEYDFDETYSLELELVDSIDAVTMSLVVSGHGNNDSAFVGITSGDSIRVFTITSNLVYTREDAALDFSPRRVQLWGDNYSGLIELSLIKGTAAEEPVIPGEMNQPMVISTNYNFHYYLVADDYTGTNSQLINLDYSTIVQTYTDLLVTGFSSADTLFISFSDTSDSLIRQYEILTDTVISGSDWVIDFEPAGFQLEGTNLDGVIDLLISK